MTRRRGRPGAKPHGPRIAPILAAAVAALWPGWVAATRAPSEEPVPVALAMAGTEHYCTGYESTFHGEWSVADDARASVPPVLFRIGANAGGTGCYAQLNVRVPPGIAPYELPRFRARARGGNTWTLRYRDIVLELDAGSGTAIRREGADAPRRGVLRDRPPPVGNALPPPSTRQRARWYGKWRGRISQLPFPVTLRFSDAGADRVRGRISMLLLARSFTGRFHGEMLIFRWRNSHVGLVMEPGSDTLVYTDYRGRVFRFRRRG